MVRINREELAWAAGFFDGEGSAYFVKRAHAWSPYVALAVSQTDERPLRRFQHAVGLTGHFEEQHRKSPCKTIWHVRYTSFEQAQAVAAMLWPFLSAPKREQIAAVFTKYHKVYRERYPNGAPAWTITRELNRRKQVTYGQ